MNNAEQEVFFIFLEMEEKCDCFLPELQLNDAFFPQKTFKRILPLSLRKFQKSLLTVQHVSNLAHTAHMIEHSLLWYKQKIFGSCAMVPLMPIRTVYQDW